MTTALVAGASGHVGSRLVRALEQRGIEVRAVSRSGGEGLIVGDVADRGSMLELLWGVDVAYYLVHSLGLAGKFEEDERRAAETFAAAARDRGVERLVYLGGIVHDDALSPHLESRREVGEILRGSGIPTIEFRTSIVVGAGSASFELVRDLVDALPVLVGPDWLDNPAQPIGVDDVVAYLVAALDVSLEGSVVYEIGGADRGTYRDLVDEIARRRGRPGVLVSLPVPWVPVGASTLPERLGELVPERARLAANLLESLRYGTAVEDDAALRDFDVRPVGLREAVAEALA
ncbi:MAG TPA: NAD(P)H-binding protein [Gaiellaceae bacterium]